MNRVPASLAVVMLAASGHPVSPITLRSWVYRGHISRQAGGYDLGQILKYIERRTMDELGDILNAVARRMTTEARDWSLTRGDAWLYGLFVGWECDDQHQHGELCPMALDEVAREHGWTIEDLKTLRRQHSAIRAAQQRTRKDTA